MSRSEAQAQMTIDRFSKESSKMNALGSPRRFLGITLAAIVLALAAAAAPASAEFGFKSFDVQFKGPDATPENPLDNPIVTQAGSHPYSLLTTFDLNYTEPEPFKWLVDGGQIRNFALELPAGVAGNPSAVPECSLADFLALDSGAGSHPKCPNDSAVGIAAVNSWAPSPFFYINVPMYNLEPPQGVPVQLGLVVLGIPVIVEASVKQGDPYNITTLLPKTPQAISTFGAVVQIWGNPSDPAHDSLRGQCLIQEAKETVGFSFTEGEVDFSAWAKGNCPAGGEQQAFLTTPTRCEAPGTTTYSADSWENPGVFAGGTVQTHDGGEPPQPQPFTGCGKLGFGPEVKTEATSDSAESGTGLDFILDFRDEGLANPDGLAQSHLKKAEVTLPEGMTINPSIGEGLGVCTPGDLERETLQSAPGEGCPNSSKIGTLHLESPLVDEDIGGSVFLAPQDDPGTTTPGAENPFDSLIALYLVLKNTNLAVNIKLPLKVEPDPQSGRLVASIDNAPQLPFSRFHFHFREGQRAALVTPPACGSYTTEAKFWPYSDPENPRTVTSSFQITEGVDDGPCPPGGIPPFKPHFEAGAMNNNAGSFSPFNMRLIRNDGEQNMTKFSSVLPPGQIGSLVGVDKCPDIAVAVAKSKTGREELANPSCPANSQIGRTLAGAGVGSALTYVGGQIYLGGPYKGAPLSVIAITPAVAGPFDAGTVAVRLGLTLNPKTAEVEVDGAASDPIPHILKGIVLKVRDLRVYVDRPNFILNPTSCDPSSAKATLFGSFLDVFNPADDVPVDLSTRYQAANCLNLGFKPKLKFNLKGGTKRGGHPGLRALYRPRKGDANVEGLVVRLPRSAFLDQAHIRTICTRVQFAADNCPKGAQYGYIRAWTPLLEEPLQGPVWLRSSNHKLPDLVFDLHGLVDVEVATRIDSVKGGIRAKVESAPDAPLTKVELRMQGGRKGLIVNSRNLCFKSKRNRANVRFEAHNGKRFTRKPVMRADGCAKKRRAKHSRRGTN